MKKIKKIALFVISMIIPVILAACYGVPADYPMYEPTTDTTIDTSTDTGK